MAEIPEPILSSEMRHSVELLTIGLKEVNMKMSQIPEKELSSEMKKNQFSYCLLV